jgi:hypothetical protein
MGTRGPVGKRSDQKHGHRSQEEKAEYEQVTVDAPPARMPAPDETWDPIARGWYAALDESGQSRFYQPSDWATARYIAEAMSRNLTAGRFSGQLFAAIMSGMSDLLVTEGDRRRVKLELQRTGAIDGDPDEMASVTAISDWQRKLTG